MLYELKDATHPGDVYYIDARAVTSIVYKPVPNQKGLVNAEITAGGVSLRNIVLRDGDFQAFLAEVQKTA